MCVCVCVCVCGALTYPRLLFLGQRVVRLHPLFFLLVLVRAIPTVTLELSLNPLHLCVFWSTLAPTKKLSIIPNNNREHVLSVHSTFSEALTRQIGDNKMAEANQLDLPIRVEFLLFHLQKTFLLDKTGDDRL